MNSTCSRWLLIWGALSCIASTAPCQQPTEVLPPPAADVPSAENVPVAAAECVRGYDQRSALARWWQDRMKPHLQYSHWGYADEFEEVPFGASIVAAQQVQICNGWADRLVLYRYDFCEGSALLNPAGVKRLNELAGASACWAHHVLLIEPTPENAQLDNARQRHVLELLSRAGVGAQVAIGTPAVSGMEGNEARIVNGLLMQQILGGGQTAAPASTGVGVAAAP